MRSGCTSPSSARIRRSIPRSAISRRWSWSGSSRESSHRVQTVSTNAPGRPDAAKAAVAASISSSRRGWCQATLIPSARLPASSARATLLSPTMTVTGWWGRGNVSHSSPRSGRPHRVEQVERPLDDGVAAGHRRLDGSADGVHLGGPAAAMASCPRRCRGGRAGRRSRSTDAAATASTPGVAAGDVGDHGAQPDRRGRRGERAEEGERLEHVVAAEAPPGEVVVDPRRPEAGRLRRLGGVAEDRPRVAGRVELDVDQHVRIVPQPSTSAGADGPAPSGSG